MKLTEQGGATSSTTSTGARARVTIISPGQGSSGYYSPEVIAEAAPLFEPGTHMYLDHATESERAERGVRSLDRLVGVLETAPTLNHNGALVADVKIMPAWREFVKEAYPYIGVSISASGEIEESEQGRVIKKLTAVESVDFVTKAGRGGKIDALLESAVTEATARDKEAAIRAAAPSYVADYDDDYIYIEAEYENGYTRQPYTWDGVKVTLTGSPEPVTRETIYHPHNGGLKESEKRMSVTLTEAEHKALLTEAEKAKAATGKVAELEAKIAELTKELEAEKAKTAQAQESAAQATAEAVKAQATAIVEEAFQGITAPAGKARLIEAVQVDGFDAEAFRATVTEAAAEYAPASPVKGMGAPGPETQSIEEAEKAILTNLGVNRG